MALPNDPKTRLHAAPRVVAIQAPDLCMACLGAGSYLEALEGGHRYEYLPVICDCCEGSGHRRG